LARCAHLKEREREREREREYEENGMREEETKRQIARYARFWNHSVVRGEHLKLRFLALVLCIFSRPKESFSEV